MNTRRAQFLALFAFAAMLYGGKLWVIGAYGNAVPYWDQWPGEAGLLYKPLLSGTLHWASLFAPHNEHRILTTRLLDLGLLKLNGIWNPLLQMVVNAALHVLALSLLVAMLARAIGCDQLPALLLFALVLFGIPCGWENTLCGFQSEFYFVLLFSIACLWLTAADAPLSASWWAGLACAALAFLSLASGVCAAAAAAAVGLIHYALRLRRTRKQLLAIAILAGLAISEAALTPSMPHHEALKAASAAQFLHSWASILGWPIAFDFRLAPIVNLPALLFVGAVLRRRPPAGSRDWFLLALVVWAVIQNATVAYGRAAGFFPSRYLDLYAIGVLANFACAIWLAQQEIKQPAGWWMPAVAIWSAVILVSLGVSAAGNLPEQLAEWHNSALAQEANTRAYLATGDFKHLQDKPQFHVPYPDSKSLACFLASPEIRSILPANIRPDAKRGRLDRKVSRLLASYQLFLIAGLASAFALLMQRGLASKLAASGAEYSQAPWTLIPAETPLSETCALRRAS
jgi:hypothetical protein